jgi:uncharacterized protein (DUF433 family)
MILTSTAPLQPSHAAKRGRQLPHGEDQGQAVVTVTMGYTMENHTNHHAAIEMHAKIAGGRPVIAGTRIKVSQIAVEYARLGWTPDQIVDAHPHLTLAQVHAALAYYYAHQAELDREIREGEAAIRELRARTTPLRRCPTVPVRFYLDESVPVSIAAGLRRRGVDAVTARAM